MRRRKRKQFVILIIVSIVVIAFVCFTAFTSAGYLLTIKYRGFTQSQDNIYIDHDYQGDYSEALSIIRESGARLKDFWGDVQSRPTIIISDNEKKLTQLGWTGNSAFTTTFVLNGAHSYIVISPAGLNVDVVAHELTHAELHARIHARRLFPSALIPVWFDEGVALQNDYRERYDDDAWSSATDNGARVTDFSNLETTAQFFVADVDARRVHYIISRYEIQKWIEEHGKEELFRLIDEVNKGADFYGLYDK